MRDDEKGTYSMFCEQVLSHVVGREVWKKRCHTNAIEEFVTVSDEAFALFLLENSWDVWIATSAKETEIPETRYSQRGPGIKKYGGWTEEGIERFNKLYDIVEEDRAHNKGKFDTGFKERKLAEIRGKTKTRKRKAELLPEEKHVKARIEVACDKVAGMRRVEKV
jgi:hypothetical protein